ncbi:MAG: two pore domain potassium channel family protein [Acidimicrobiales bacterium]|nr:MAG: two pore domain potassium channel family protein [Acidimicrobiales bacterium]
MLGLAALIRVTARGVRSLARDEHARGLVTLALTLIGAGAVFYHQVEDLSWVDSFYFTVITLTTVGYGDIAPETTAGKIFTMFYVLIGIGILVALITEVARHVLSGNGNSED